MAGSSTTMFASPSTRLPISSPTPARCAVLSGAQMAPSLHQAATTTLSPSGMPVRSLLQNSRRRTTTLRSRPSHGAHGSTTSLQPVVARTIVTSTSGTPPLARASTPSTLVAKSPACGGATTTRRLQALPVSQTTAFPSGRTHRLSRMLRSQPTRAGSFTPA